MKRKPSRQIAVRELAGPFKDESNFTFHPLLSGYLHRKPFCHFDICRAGPDRLMLLKSFLSKRITHLLGWGWVGGDRVPVFGFLNHILQNHVLSYQVSLIIALVSGHRLFGQFACDFCLTCFILYHWQNLSRWWWHGSKRCFGLMHSCYFGLGLAFDVIAQPLLSVCSCLGRCSWTSFYFSWAKCQHPCREPFSIRGTLVLTLVICFICCCCFLCLFWTPGCWNSSGRD